MTMRTPNSLYDDFAKLRIDLMPWVPKLLFKQHTVSSSSLQESEYTYRHCCAREGISADHLLDSAAYLTSVFLPTLFFILLNALL